MSRIARARCARSVETYAISRSGSRKVLASMTRRSCSAAARITPAAIAAKYGSPTSWQISPTVLLEALASAWAWALGM